MMSIHGILSNGNWQEMLDGILSEEGLHHREFKYGFTIRFDPLKINKIVDKFRAWYFRICNDGRYELDIREPFHRPSIVAHSLGTWILAKAMQKYPEIKFDKIFLHGAIIPKTYDWYKLILNDQIGKVVLERANKDYVIPWSFFITGSMRPCSSHGFLQESSYIKIEPFPNFGHSDFQYPDHFKSIVAKHLYEVPVQLKLQHGKELDMKVMNKYFKRSEKIDTEVYGKVYTDSNPVTLERAQEWAAIEKNIWSFLIHSYTKEVIGYINVLALDNETHARFLKGEISENDISGDQIKSFDIVGGLNLVVMSIALDKKIREGKGDVMTSKAGEFLIMALSKKILDISNNGKKINSLTSVAWTTVGGNLSKSFGLKKTAFVYNSCPIYSINLNDLKNRIDDDIRPLARWWINQVQNN